MKSKCNDYDFCYRKIIFLICGEIRKFSKKLLVLQSITFIVFATLRFIHNLACFYILHVMLYLTIIE